MFDELDQLLDSDLFATSPQGEVLKLQERERREVAVLIKSQSQFTLTTLKSLKGDGADSAIFTRRQMKLNIVELCFMWEESYESCQKNHRA